jgi:hypothetical protein
VSAHPPTPRSAVHLLVNPHTSPQSYPSLNAGTCAPPSFSLLLLSAMIAAVAVSAFLWSGMWAHGRVPLALFVRRNGYSLLSTHSCACTAAMAKPKARTHAVLSLSPAFLSSQSCRCTQLGKREAADSRAQPGGGAHDDCGAKAVTWVSPKSFTLCAHNCSTLRRLPAMQAADPLLTCARVEARRS